MIALLQRVQEARVSVSKKVIAKIGYGYCILLGIAKTDTAADIEHVVKKISTLKLNSKKQDKFANAINEVNGELLVVSQFTLYADLNKGLKPSFSNAMESEAAKRFYNKFCDELETKTRIKVNKGKFGAYMQLQLVNDGPATFIITSKK